MVESCNILFTGQKCSALCSAYTRNWLPGVSTQGKENNLFPLTSQQQISPAPLSTESSALGSGKCPTFTYLAVRKGTETNKSCKKLTKGRCMAGKEKHCSFTPSPASQATIVSSRHHADTPSHEQQAAWSLLLPPPTFPWLEREGWWWWV